MDNYSVMISSASGMQSVEVQANSFEEAQAAAESQVSGVVIMVAKK